MANKLLVVVDMQNDFTFGALKNDEAIRIIPNVIEKIKAFDGQVVFTRDTHTEDYMNTQEGRKLPVIHCVKDTDGWELVDGIKELSTDSVIFDKPTFGSTDLMEAICDINDDSPLDEVELIGVCTDICVISNAMLIKAALPELTVKVDSSCCAGVTTATHDTALNAMKSCQIEVY